MTLSPAGRHRIAVFGKRGSHRTEASITRAAKALGHEAIFIDVARWHSFGPAAPALLRWRLDVFAPDVLLFTRYAAELGEGTIRRLCQGRWAAVWYFDLPLTPAVLHLGRTTGRVFTTYHDTVPLYLAAGIEEAHWLPQGMDPAIDRPVSAIVPDYRCDASFIGSGPYPHRWPILRAVAGACDLQVRGPGWEGAPSDLPLRGGEIRGEEFARATAAARISLGASFSPDQARSRYSASNRMWKVLGCGGFFLGEHVEGIERLAQGGVHCDWYRGTDDVIQRVRHWLAHPEERARVAAAGRTHALRAHTYAHRLGRLLEGRGYDPDEFQVRAPGKDQTRV